MNPTILQTLRAEHLVIRDLCEQLQNTSGGGGTRDQLWYRLKSELLTHAEAEERALYSRMTEFDGTRHLAEHSIEEHEAIDELVAQLDHMGFDQPSWSRTLDRLVHVSTHHLDEEEVELFPVAGRVLPKSLLHDATATYREEKQRLQGEFDRRIRTTTQHGADGRTLEDRPLAELRGLARDRNVQDVNTANRSTLISAIRGVPSTDA